MNVKEDICSLLQNENISFQIVEHEAAYTMEDLAEIDDTHSDAVAKNLFVHNDKKDKYYLVTVRGSKRVNLKEFRKKHSLRNLSFASAEELSEYLNLTPGAVTPFGLLNDKEHKVDFYFDKSFVVNDSTIGCHPNVNTASVFLKARDLVELLEKNGVNVILFDCEND